MIKFGKRAESTGRHCGLPEKHLGRALEGFEGEKREEAEGTGRGVVVSGKTGRMGGGWILRESVFEFPRRGLGH